MHTGVHRIVQSGVHHSREGQRHIIDTKNYGFINTCQLDHNTKLQSKQN